MFDIIKLEDQSIDILAIDEEIKDRINAIEVAIKLLRLLKPMKNFYTLNALPIGGYIQHNISVDLNIYGERKITVYSPTFVWGKWIKNINYMLIIECEDDYTVKYPINCYLATQITHAKIEVANEVFYKEDVIRFLDHILGELGEE